VEGILPSLLGFNCLPATLADTRSRHGVLVHPAFAVGSYTCSASNHSVGVSNTAKLACSGLLLASTAFLVRQINTLTYDDPFYG